MKNNKKNLFLVILMIVVAAVTRLLPHPPNFSPVLAMAMFGGAYIMNRKFAFLIPIAILFISDLVLNNTGLGYIVNPGQFTFFSAYALWVYVPVIIMVVLGMRLMKKVNLLSVVGYTLVGSIIFFLISNFGSFITLPMYTKDVSGLLMSYVNGLPFFRNALLGNLAYSIVLFGTYEWIQNKSFILSLTKAK